MMQRRIGIDVGSLRTRLVNVDRQEAIDDYSVIAVQVDKKGKYEPIGVGQEALRLSEDQASPLKLIWPVEGGAIKDHEATMLMLQGFSQRLRSGSRLSSAWVMAANPAQKADHVTRTIVDVIRESMIATVALIPDLMAVAVGQDSVFDMAGSRPCCVVHLGAGYGSAGVLADGHIKQRCQIGYAGAWLDICIQRSLFDKLGYVVPLDVCREAKHMLGALDVTGAPRQWQHRVTDTEGHVHEVGLTSEDIQPVLAKGLAPIVDELRWFIKLLPAEYASATREGGVMLSGGCAELRDMPFWLSGQLGVPVRVARDPSKAVIQGIAKFISDSAHWAALTKSKQQRR
jgi:rod shape-determining protein MreB